jgi:hypothetical protein
VSKPSSLVLSSVLALASVGCAMNRPPIMTPDHAIDTFKGRLAESCGEKHLDLLPADALYKVSKKTQYTADTNTRQIIDLDIARQCGKGDGQPNGPACFNTGVIQAEIQVDALHEFVKDVCGMPAKCTESGQCSVAAGE